MLEKNIHPVERAARAVVGLFLLSLVFWGPRTMWGLVGLAPLLTAAVGWCPPYSWLGINTCNLGKSKPKP